MNVDEVEIIPDVICYIRECCGHKVWFLTHCTFNMNKKLVVNAALVILDT